jgi:hypothetical protein
MHAIERLLKGFERFQQHYFEDAPALSTHCAPASILRHC